MNKGNRILLVVLLPSVGEGFNKMVLFGKCNCFFQKLIYFRELYNEAREKVLNESGLEEDQGRVHREHLFNIQ